MCVDYTVVFFTDSAFVRVKPERQGVSYPAASCGPLAAPSTSLRRVALAHEPSARRPPRRTATLSVNQDVVRPTPVGQVFFSIFYSAPDRVAEYCDELVCLSVCVCLSVRDHVFGSTRPIFTSFLCVLPVAVARSSSDGVVVRYVLSVYG